MEVSKKVCNCARRKEGDDRQLRHAVPRSAECRRVSGLVQLSSTLKVRNGKGTDQDIPDTFRSRPLSIDFCTASPRASAPTYRPWQARLSAIQAGRDTARSEGTRRLLIAAPPPVPEA